MRQYRTELRRLQRELEQRQRARSDEPAEPIPYRVYELDEDGRRVLVAKDEGDLALEEWARRLVHGR